MPTMNFSDQFLNEDGVAVVSNGCPSREDTGELTGGGIGPMLRRLVAQRARTAREGVRIVGQLIDTYGYSDTGRTLIICDASEGWVVCLVKGKHWVAERVPDDKVAVIANSYTVRTIDLSDTLNFAGSPDIIEYARKRGWYNPSKGEFSFEAAYANQVDRSAIFNTHRQWSGYNIISGGNVSVPEEQPLPFCVEPDQPVTPEILFSVLRDHYEGTPYTADKTPDSHPHKGHTLSICRPQTNSGSVFQLRSYMPSAIGNVWWLALWQPCSAPFVPVYQGVEYIPPQLYYPVDPGNNADYRSLPEDKAYRVLGDLARITDENYIHMISVVRPVWEEFEQRGFLLQREVEKSAMVLWNYDRASAIDLLTRFSQGSVVGTMHKAHEMIGALK
jgi:dipeptidase